jgi:tetratricopeptide (TPR) repeat protein
MNEGGPRPRASAGGRSTWVILGIILLVGLALRVSYLTELVGKPDYSHPLADAAFHDYWARALSTGAWSPPGDSPDPHLREAPFLRAPGYSYFLAFIYTLTGGSYLGPRIVQMALGLLNCLLAFMLGRAIFHRTAGFIMAALGAVYWGLIYFEGELLPPALDITLTLGMFLILWDWCRRPAWWRLALAGLLAGLDAITRENVLPFIVIGALWALWMHRRQRMPGRAAAAGLAFLAGALVAIVPVTIRNAVVAHEFVLVSCNGPVNLYIGNNAESDGISSRIPGLVDITGANMWSWFTYNDIVQGLGRRAGRVFTYNDAGRYFTREATDYIRAHPGRFLSLTLRRAALFWGPAEVSNNKSDQNEKSASPTLRYLLSFPWVLSLSLLGLVLMILDLRQARGGRKPTESTWPLWPARGFVILVGAYILSYFSSFLPFLVAGRFRVPLIPLLFFFGAYGLYRLGESIRQRNWKGAAMTGGLGVALFALASIPLVPYEASAAWWHTDRASALIREGKTTEAIAELRAALQANPGFVDANVQLAALLAQQGQAEEALAHYRTVLQYRPTRSDVRLAASMLLIDMGRAGEAERDLRTLVQSGPPSADVHAQLGRALANSGKLAEATSELERALELDPGHAVAHYALGVVLQREGRTDEALSHLRQATTTSPTFVEAHCELGRVLAASGALAEAEQSYRTALQLRPRDATVGALLGNLYLQQGRSDEAIAVYRQVLAVSASDVGTRCNLAVALANQGHIEDAVRELQEAQRIAPGNAAVTERLNYFRTQLQKGAGAKR